MSVSLRTHRFIENPPVYLKDHRLKFVNEIPYLGHIITNDQKDAADIEHRTRKLCSLGNMITRRFVFCRHDTNSNN